MADRPIALDAYEAIAEAYAATVDTKPHNAYYERPATLSLLPDVEGKRVLDAGCGPGVYSEWLIGQGAHVVSVDASSKMVELTKRRLKKETDIWTADLSRPLTFLSNASFDIVLSTLVLDYIKDWKSIFTEFYRVLHFGGHLVFSVHHPLWDYFYFNSNDYFAIEPVICEWHGFGDAPIHMPSFRRPLNEFFNPLTEAGFCIEKLVEPKPTHNFKNADPQGYEELNRQPLFLSIRAKKIVTGICEPS